MNTKALRQKVLDLAIHGKLVPQNPNDESATVLLEKIRAEKAEKIKKGELKADKKDSFIFVGSDKRHYEQFADGTVKNIEDEIPFEVPEGWAWCRIKEVCTVFGRIGFRGYTRDDLVEKGNGAITLSPSNLINMKLDLTDCTYISWPKYEESPEIQLDINDIVIVKTGSSYGKTSLVDNLTEKTTLNPQLMVLKERKCNSKYLCYFLNTQYMRKHFEDLVNGTAIPTFSQEKFGMKLFPLPPVSEQEKIVSRIELIFDKIDLLENDKEDLDTIIKQTKSKILDLAIHGKLVPQNPNDEPAEELLKRIATSDNRPYKKLDDEGPFDIPESWAWCKLGEICDYGKCINVNSSDLKADDWILDLEDIEKDSGKIIAFHNFGERKSESTKHKFLKGQVLYSKLRPYLNKVVIAPKDGFCTSEILPLDFKGILLPRYAQVLLMSSYFLEMVNMVTYGVKMPRLGTNDAKNMHIPLPPLAEQQRIVSKIENLFSILDSILVNLE